MGSFVEFKIPLEALRRIRRIAGTKGDGIIVQALNDTAKTARSSVVKLIADTLRIKQKDIRKKHVNLKKARKTDQISRVRVTGAGIPLIRFGARQTKRGVIYNLPQNNFRAGAFIATMGSGHKGVFIRRRRWLKEKGVAFVSRRGPRGQELPIDELMGPTAQSVLNKTNLKEISDQMADVLARNLKKRLARALAQSARAKGPR